MPVTTYNPSISQSFKLIMLVASVSLLIAALLFTWFIFNSSATQSHVATKEKNIISDPIQQKPQPNSISIQEAYRSNIQVELNQEIQHYPNQSIQVWFSEINQEKPIATYQANKPMLAASLIKLLILAEALKQKQSSPSLFSKPIHIDNAQKVLGSGILHYLPPQETVNGNLLMYLMITESDNTAANKLITLLGQDKINQYARHLGLKQTLLRNPLMQNAHFKQSCSINQCNITSPEDLAKLLKHLNQNPEARFILSHQVDQKGIPALFPNAQVLNKTGTLLHQRSETALIEYQGHHYLLIISISGLQNPNQGNMYIHQILKPIAKYIAHLTSTTSVARPKS